MSNQGTISQRNCPTEFRRHGLVADFLEYLMENKKWWILPIIIGILLLMLLILVSAPAVLPFIYPIFG
jgi:hypothetical protein